ncbi:MAG: hypothetical protein J5I53_11115 [Bradyrhizobiaceae bacterium]|nr:hypothetical protein [Bradyrhizobiaceae bacterium]
MTIQHHRWRRLKRPIKVLFLVLVLASATYLTVLCWSIVVDARTSLGLTRANVPGIDNLLAVTDTTDIPRDGLLRPYDVHLCIRVAELADSLETAKAKQHHRISAFATLLNTHATSRHSYIWARGQLQRAIMGPSTHTDSVNARLVEIMEPRIATLRTVYRNHLDTLIINPLAKK